MRIRTDARDQQDQLRRSRRSLIADYEQAVIDREVVVAETEMVRDHLREALDDARADRDQAEVDAQTTGGEGP